MEKIQSFEKKDNVSTKDEIIFLKSELSELKENYESLSRKKEKIRDFEQYETIDSVNSKLFELKNKIIQKKSEIEELKKNITTFSESSDYIIEKEKSSKSIENKIILAQNNKNYIAK